MKRKTAILKETTQLHIEMRDYNKEFMLHLEEKNHTLLEKQDYEINLATLNERNRIARDIHDSIGHQLTSAILQVGAVLVTATDATQRHQLQSIKQTLDSGMNSIRSSIHNLYETSIDLETELQQLVNDFTFCKVTFQYQFLSQVPTPVKYALLAITKEALTNIVKHTNATHCTITLKEHPALYQYRMEDNGTCFQESNSGIGIINMKERIRRLRGYMQVTTSQGWQIFITIPKEDFHESYSH